MVYKDEVCMWFKDNESHRRLELLCGLLNMCLPFELRFIRTCVEDLGKRDDLLRDFDLKANNSSEINQLGKVLDERTRSKFVVYVALLEANNQTCSKILFETLSNAQELPNSALSDNLSDINYIKEMLLIYTMVLHHPAFTFEEKRVIGDRFQTLQNLEKQITQTKQPWSHNKSSFGLEVNSQDLSIDTCHSISSPTHVYEACDSGLSIGTEPEAEVLSDHVCVPTANHLPHGHSSLSTDNTFNDLSFTQSSPTISRPTLNPSIGTRNSSEKLPSSSLVNLSEPPSLMQHGPPPENRRHILPNRDASSSGSGESLDLYGESVSVPTTYIYNSNIYDQQNLNEVPTMALGNNLINLTPGYMYQHNGRCQFYHYPPLMGGVLSPSSVSVPQKVAAGDRVSSETSSSEEGVNGAIPASNTKLLLLRSNDVPPYSSLSSSQSSPYASPPQSPNGSTVTTSAPSLESPQSLVTGTTTTIDLPKSSPRPPVRNRSHTSSPGPIPPSSQIISRCKPPMATKGQKHPTIGERPNPTLSRGSPNLSLSENTNGSSITTSPVTNGPTLSMPFVSKESDGLSGSFSTNKEAVLSTCTSTTSLNGAYVRTNVRPLDNTIIISKPNGMLSSYNATNSLQCQNLETAIQPKTAPEISSAPLSSHPLNNGSLNPSSSPSPMSSMLSSGHQRDSYNDTELIPTIKANNMKNLREENQIKDNSSEEIKVIEEVDKLKLKSALEEKDTSVVSLPNGFNEYLCISSSAHSIQVKHSDSQTLTTSVPSCSCTTVSLHSDPCKMSVSTVGNCSRQKIIPPLSHNVVNDNFTGKVNKPIHPAESTAQNSFPSLLPAVTHTVSAKMLYNSPPLRSTEAPESFSSPRPSLPSTCPPIFPHTTTRINASSKYSCSTVTLIHSSTNGAPVLKKTRPTENGQQLQVSAPPTGPAFIGGNVKATPAANTPPTFTTTTSSTSTTMMSLMPSPGTYPPYFSIPMLPGAASSYLPQGGFSHHTHSHPRNHPSHTFFLASPSGVVHSPSRPLMKGNPSHSILLPPGSNLGHPKSRGSSSSGRSGSNSSGSSSSSIGLGRKKVFVRAAPHQNKSRSSDSSPSSSQYSSPPQTPSPDHTHEARSKPPKGVPVAGRKLPEGVAYPVDEGWEAPDSNGAPCLPCANSREEGTPPPHPLGPQIMIPSNPVRQRYMPYPPLGFIGYPQPPHVMYRYSLASPSVLMGSPRTQTPLGSEKSSRETTPPIHSHVPPPPPLEKGVDFAMTAAPSSTSPPIPGPLSETSSVTLVPPPPGPPAAGPAGPPPTGGTMHQYNGPNYPMFAMGAAPFVAHLSGFLPSSSALPNGYVSPHTLPPNFPVPSVAPGMTSGGGELMYPPAAPFPVITQTTLATSSSCGVVAAHPTVPPPYSGPPYQPPLLHSSSVPPAPKKPQSCYNCGKVGHRGAECHEASIDEMTKRTKVL